MIEENGKGGETDGANGAKQRVFAFDELRGVMILSMLVYHICYDLAELVRLKGMSWFYSEAAGWWQLSICGAFILVSGACCAYSRNNLKRGLKLLGLGMFFTLVTVLVLPQQRILFGLLHFLGTTVLLSIPRNLCWSASHRGQDLPEDCFCFG